MDFIDSHAHLYQEDFDSDLETVISNAQEIGVSQVLLPNIDSLSIDRLLRVCDRYPDYLKPMMGLHPTSIKENYQEELELIHNALTLNRSRFIAIGEVGLDFYWDISFKKEQILAFEKQLNWSLEEDLPVVIHARNAYSEIEEILNKPEFENTRGVIHSFSGEEKDLDRFLPLENWMIGINGIVTFKNSNLSKFIKKIPLDRLLIETDSPYLAPVPFRGRRNESAYVFHVIRKLAEIYNISLERMADQTKMNTFNLFAL